MLQSVCCFRRSFCHILANFVAIIPFRSSFERVFPKNVSILRFKLHFGRIFVQNALVCAVWWLFERIFPQNALILLFRTSFGRIFRKNVTILPLFVVRLIAAVVFIPAPCPIPDLCLGAVYLLSHKSAGIARPLTLHLKNFAFPGQSFFIFQCLPLISVTFLPQTISG